MNRILANIKGFTKKAIILGDYLLWLILDLSKFRIIDKKRIKKVLIIHLGAFGEILASTPIIDSLVNERIIVHYMLRGGRQEVLENNHGVRKIILWDDDIEKNISVIKKESYDAAIILWPGSTRIASMCRRAGIKYRVGCFKGVKEGLSFSFTRRRFPLRRVHSVVANAQMVRLLGITPKKPRMNYYIDKKSEAFIKKYLKMKHVKKFVIIHPGFGASRGLEPNARLWPTDRYAKVADELVSKGYSVLITGSDNERVIADSIYSKSKKKMIILTNGLFNFKQLAALVSRSSLVIAPDTSIVHLASALQVPVVDLVSRNPVWEWHPWMNHDKYVLISHFGNTNFFERDFCPEIGISCMNSITTGEVISAANKLLKIKD
jgi:ADP-heptose:LPS heptosyltransferase